MAQLANIGKNLRSSSPNSLFVASKLNTSNNSGKRFSQDFTDRIRKLSMVSSISQEGKESPEITNSPSVPTQSSFVSPNIIRRSLVPKGQTSTGSSILKATLLMRQLKANDITANLDNTLRVDESRVIPDSPSNKEICAEINTISSLDLEQNGEKQPIERKQKEEVQFTINVGEDNEETKENKDDVLEDETDNQSSVRKSWDAFDITPPDKKEQGLGNAMQLRHRNIKKKSTLLTNPREKSTLNVEEC